LIESETGYSVNEPVNYAVRAAIEAGVVEIIYEGEEKGLWKFKEEDKTIKQTLLPEVDIGLPELRPLKLNEALKKWPDARLACSANNLCRPMSNPHN
jgi:hypothetical protein